MSEITEKIEELNKIVVSENATKEQKLIATLEIGALEIATTDTKKQQDETLNAVVVFNRVLNIFKKITDKK